MAWNRSDKVETKLPLPRRRPPKPAWVKGAVAGAVVILGAVLAFVFLFPAAEQPQPEPQKVVKKPRQEVKAAKPKASVKETEPIEVKVDPDARPTKVGETLNGYILLPSGRLHKVKGVITNDVSATQFKGKYEIFSHHSENEIACLLTIKPGDGLVGTPLYNGRVTKDFLESLKDPIVINPEDSEEDKELKRNMIEVKAQLKERMDKGEDLEEILLETRKEYQKLAEYKMELQAQVNELKKGEGVTDQDVEDVIEAANRMLENKGIAPLKMVGPITRQKIKMLKQKGEY